MTDSLWGNPGIHPACSITGIDSNYLGAFTVDPLGKRYSRKIGQPRLVQGDTRAARVPCGRELLKMTRGGTSDMLPDGVDRKCFRFSRNVG